MRSRPWASRRLALAVVLALSTAAGAGTVVFISQRASARAMRQLSAAFIQEVATRAEAATLSYLSAGPRSLEALAAMAADSREDDLVGSPAVESRLRALLGANREIEMFNVGQPDGDFMMAKRMPDGSLSIKRVRRSGSVAVSTWQHDNRVWSGEEPYRDRREPAAEAYDPRTRTWYGRAVERGGLIWIEPYVFFSDRMPGIACSLPLFDAAGSLRAVVGADIGIADLSRQLESYRIGKTGQALILTAEGRIIAKSKFARDGFGTEVMTPAGPQVELRSVLESVDSVLAAAFAARPPAHGGKRRPYRFVHRGVAHVARLDPFPIGADQSWLVGVVVPQDDFLGPLRREQALTLSITVACLILAVALGVSVLWRSSRRELALLRARNDEKQEFIDALEAKNAEIESFVLAVSHDLRSPLVTIGGFLGGLESELGRCGSARARSDLQEIRRAVGHMGRMLAELLDFSRLGRAIGRTEEVAMTGLAAEAAGHLRGLLDEAAVALVIDPDLPPARGDRRRLRAVYQNLIENAVKYMGGQPAPAIEVGARREGGQVIYTVRDNGIGIEPADQERIFELFCRLSREVAGTGVGLAAVRRIVDLHGGEVWVESEGAGTGSTFCFTLR